MMIETERLILRPFLEKDAADVFEYLEKPAVNCFACMSLSSLEEVKKRSQKPGRRRTVSCHHPKGDRQGDRRDFRSPGRHGPGR